MSIPTPTTIATALTVLDRVAGQVRAVEYLRVSTEEQVKGYGLAYSKRKTSGYIARKGWTLVGTYADEGVSGTLVAEDRDDLARLMEDARRVPRPFDMVVVNEGRVIGRAGKAFWPWVWELEALGIFVAVVVKDYDNSTAEGRSKMRKDQDYAEDERENILTRTQSGRQEKALMGGWLGGPPPYGYLIKNQGMRGESELDENPAESRVARAGRQLFVAHLNWGAAAEKVNDKGPDWYDRNGNPWNRQTLRVACTGETLLNAGYTFRGKRAKRGEDGQPIYGEPVFVPVPRILSDAEVAELREAQRLAGRKPAANTRTYPLTGHVRSKCGSTYHGSASEGPISYICNRRWTVFRERCTCPKLPAAELETRVWSDISAFLGDDERLRETAERWAGTAMRGVDFGARVAEYDKQIKQQDSLISVTLAAAARQAVASGLDGAAADDMVAEMLRPLTEERTKLVKARAEAAAWAADAEAAEKTARDIHALAEMARDRLVHISPEDQSRIYKLLGIQVELLGDPAPARAGRKCEVRAWFQESGRPVPEEGEEMWRAVDAALAALPDGPHPPSARLAIAALFYKARTGCRWAELPPRYGSAGRVRTWWWKWRAEAWAPLMEHFREVPGAPAPSGTRLPEVRVTGTLRPGLLAKTDLLDADGSSTVITSNKGFDFQLSLTA